MERTPNVSSIKIGDTLVYRLSLADLPTNPDQLWHGRIAQICTDRLGRTSYFVESLEYPDTDGELVYPFQVMDIEPAS